MSLLGTPFIHQGWGRNLLQTRDNDPGFGIIKPSGSDPSVALLNGHRIYVKPPAGRKPQLYDFRLYPQAEASPINDDAEAQRMDNELKAYIQTAMTALVSRQTGI